MEGKVKQKIPLVEEIKAAISKKGWNDATLARESGVSPVVISRLFSGSTNIKIDNLQKILNCLAIPLPMPTEKTLPGATSQGNDLVLNIIAGRLDDLSDRIKAQGNALQGLQDDCPKVKNDIQDIYKRMTDAAESNNVRRLKKVG